MITVVVVALFTPLLYEKKKITLLYLTFNFVHLAIVFLHLCTFLKSTICLNEFYVLCFGFSLLFQKSKDKQKGGLFGFRKDTMDRNNSKSLEINSARPELAGAFNLCIP